MRKKILLWTLVILWMGLIFYLSSRNSEESTSQSQGIINKTNIVEIYDKDKNEDEKIETLETIDKYFRKVAHACVYLVLSVLVCLALREHNIILPNIIVIAFIICFIYSCSDELHQVYVPGRSGEIRDIFIDNFGCMIGYFLFYLKYKR